MYITPCTYLEYYMNVSSQTKWFWMPTMKFCVFIRRKFWTLTVQMWCGVSSWRQCCVVFAFSFIVWKGWMVFILLLCKITLRKRCFVCDDFIKNDFEFYGKKANEKFLQVMNINEEIFWRQYRYKSLSFKMELNVCYPSRNISLK